MTFALSSVAVRSPTRIRVKYTTALTIGAYEVFWFSVACLDSSTPDPGVRVVFMIPGLANEMELVLDTDLSPGGAYQLTSLAGIPAADGSFSEQSVTSFNAPMPRPAPSTAVSANDVSAQLYGVDLLHDNGDFVETADGDLATITGPANAIGAAVRIGVSEALPYSANYGAQLRKYVDAPSPMARSARGDLERALRRDDRIQRVTATVGTDENDGDLTINADITLIGKTKHSVTKAVT